MSTPDWYARNAGWFAPVALSLFLLAVVIWCSNGHDGLSGVNRNAEGSTLKNVESSVDDFMATKDDIARERRDQRERADLEAQEEMAFWAEGMFWATAAAVLLTGIGIVLIWRTLLHNRRAAEASRQMVKEARTATEAAVEAADAAKDTVEVTSDIGRKQLRAYVGIAAIGISKLDQKPVVCDVMIQNFGQTPAYEFRVSAWIIVKEFPPTSKFTHWVEDHEKGQAAIYPGLPNKVTIEYPEVSKSDIAAIQNGTKAFWAYGEIRYRDAFGCDHFTRYRFFTGGSKGVHGREMTPHAQGNEAT